MKRILFTSLLMLLVGLTNSNAQIQYSGGSLKVNGVKQKNLYTLTADKWNGTYYTCKDSNFFQIDVTPQNPRIAGTGDNVVFFNTETSRFNNIQVANVYNYSDARAKENVQDIQTGLNTVMQLHPVSYEWKYGVMQVDSVLNMAPFGPLEAGKSQYGFLAQDMEIVLPDIVESNDRGFKMINYIALVPILVKAVQELQSIVDNQATVIEQLKSGTLKQAQVASANKIVQCSTNNSNDQLSVSMKLSPDISNAKLLISSSMGNNEKSISVSPDIPSVEENISSFSKGVHVVTLYVNNVPVDSRSWIKE